MDGCPKCGATDGYIVSDRANGWVRYLGDWSGAEERLDGENGLRYSRSRTVVCEACGARVERPADHIPGLVSIPATPRSVSVSVDENNQ